MTDLNNKNFRNRVISNGVRTIVGANISEIEMDLSESFFAEFDHVVAELHFEFGGNVLDWIS